MKICKIQYVPPLALSIESKPVVAFVFSLSLPISFHIPKLASIWTVMFSSVVHFLDFVDNLWFWSFKVSEIEAHWALVFWKTTEWKESTVPSFWKFPNSSSSFLKIVRIKRTWKDLLQEFQRTSNFHERKNRRFRVVSLTLVLWLFGTPVEDQKPVLFREPPVKGER